MASFTPPKSKATNECIETLRENLHEHQVKILEKSKSALLLAHRQYKTLFETLKQATNGKIAGHLRVSPILVDYAVRNIADYDFRASRFSHNRQKRNLITSSSRMVDMGLGDLYETGEKLLTIERNVGGAATKARWDGELKKLKEMKEKIAKESEPFEKEIREMDEEDLSLRMELEMQLEDEKEDSSKFQVKDESSRKLLDLSKEYKKIITQTQIEHIRLLKSHFDFIYSEWEMTVSASDAYKPTHAGKRDQRLPLDIKECFKKLPAPDKVLPSQRFTTIKELTEGTVHVYHDYLDVLKAVLDKMENKELSNKFSLAHEAEMCTYKSYSARSGFFVAKTRRYQDEIVKIEKRESKIKTPSDMAKIDEQQKEKLLKDMLKIQREKNLFCARVHGQLSPRWAKERDELDREAVEALLRGEEPWRKMREEFEKKAVEFAVWERKGGKGGIEAFTKAHPLR